MLDLLGQRNQLDQSLPSMRTPFDNRHALSKLGGISGFYGSSTQNGNPLRAMLHCTMIFIELNTIAVQFDDRNYLRLCSEPLGAGYQ
jgi:hypothetical protein